MPKGSAPAGQTTTTSVNPVQQMQQPYLGYGWEESQKLYQDQPQQYYPGQTLATPNPYTSQGYNDIYNTGQSIDQTLRPQANQVYGTAATGGYGIENSPAYGGYQSYATGTAYPQQTQQAIAQGAQNSANNYSNQIGAYGPQAAASGQQYAAIPGGYAPQAAASGQQYAAIPGGYAPQAAASGQQYAGQVGTYAPQQVAYSGQLAANNNLGLSQLGQTASGYYLPGEAGANPYLEASIQASLDPLNRNYQTVTAPTTDAAASMSGRYGSGAQAGQVSANEQNYLKAAGDVTTAANMNAYNAERQRQDAAAQAYGQQYQAGLTSGIAGLTSAANTAAQAGNLANQGYTTAGNLAAQAGGLANQGYATAGNLANQAGNLANQGYSTGANIGAQAGGLQLQGLNAAGNAANNYAANQQTALAGLQSGYQSGNQAAMNALSAYPNLAQAQYSAADAAVRAGQGLTALDQQKIADEMARYYGEQAQPYTNLNTYLQQIGQPMGGTGTVSQPYFQNPTADALALGLGATGIAKNLGATGAGTAGLTSAGGLLGSQGPLFGTAVDSVIAAGGPAVLAPTAALGAAAVPGTTAAALAPAAAWIICTELMRQGKLPKRHWAAGVRVFDGYPEIARRGYYVWAIPTVRHLRRHPDSLFAKAIGAAFRWRAEDIAARVGVRGARKLWRGRLVTAALALPCVTLGALSGRQDWRQVYRKESAA